MEAEETAVCLLVKAVVWGARWAARRRRLCLEESANLPGELGQLRAENLALRDTVELQAEQIAHLRRRLRQANVRLPYSPGERLRVLWSVEYFGIPRRQISEHFGVARSTVWRWLRRIQDGVGLCGQKCQASVAKTSEALARLVWEMASANLTLPPKTSPGSMLVFEPGEVKEEQGRWAGRHTRRSRSSTSCGRRRWS